MAVFRTVARSTDLPDIGTARETGTYDFKGSADPTAGCELAKDVAAFANAFGGVVLVGAVEDQATRTLQEYKGMKRPLADRLTTAYEQAVRDRCEPQPIMDAASIELPPLLGTGYVVVVIVRPMALGPVGVRCDNPGQAFMFPLRTATHTHYMSPTELAMLMVPEIRRVAIILDSIPREQRTDALLVTRTKGGEVDSRLATIVDVDPDLTTLTLLDNAAHLIALPLDRIASVWRRDAEHWGILLDGRLEITNETLVVLPG